MNKLRINPVQVEGDDLVYRGVELTIDGLSLLDLVCDVERPQATEHGQASIAGAYLWTADSPDFRKELLDGCKEPDDKIMLLVCSCGVPGCWPLLDGLLG